MSVEGPRRGVLAALGGAPHSFETLRFAPNDTDLFLEAELDFPAALKSVSAVLKRVDSAKAAEFDLETTAAATPKPSQILAGFRGRITAAIRVNIGKKGNITGGDLLNLAKNEAPADFFVRIEGLGTRIKPWLEQSKFPNRQVKGRKLYFPVQGDDTPAFARNTAVALDGETLVAASNEEFLDECLKRSNGLDHNPALKSALAALGNQGNSLTFASPALFRVVRQSLEWAQATFMFRQASNPFMQHVIERFPQPIEPVVSVTANLPEGIYSRSWTPQNLQIAAVAFHLLSPEILGQMVSEAVFVAQRQGAKARETARNREIIEKNLAQIDGAARSYFAAHPDALEVPWADLITAEPKLAVIKPIAGEDYSPLTVKRASDKLEVSTSDYAAVTYVRPLIDAEKAEIRRRLTLIDRAAAQYFANNDEGTSFSATEAATYEPELKDLNSIAGEDYSLYISKMDTTLHVQTEGGQEISVERDPSLALKALKERLRTETQLVRSLAPAFSTIQEYLANGEREAMTLASAVEEKLISRPEGIWDDEIGAITVIRGLYRVTLRRNSRELPLLFPLDPAKRAQAQANVQQIAKAASDYFRKHPDEDVVLAGELNSNGANSPLIKPIGDEKIDTLPVHRTDTAVVLELPTGHKMSAPLTIGN